VKNSGYVRVTRGRGMPLPLLRCLVFCVLFFLELATLDVACVEFRVMFPLLGEIIQRKNRGDRADGHACAAIDTLHWIDVELRDFFKAGAAILIGRVLLGMDAIYRAGINTGSILDPDAGFGNDIGHKPPSLLIHAMLVRKYIQAQSAQTSNG
jgi:hypothetical protein